MKTTKAQQAKTRRSLLDSAVELMSRHGFDGVSMKDIARAAGVGDATIYKYFQSKERLILGYLDNVAQDAIAASVATPGWAMDTLQSRLQRLTDAVLERLAPDREFVLVVQGLLRCSPLLLMTDQLQAKSALRSVVINVLEDAVSREEMPSSHLMTPLASLYVDYLFGVVRYWLHDESPQWSSTTRWVDETLGIYVTVMRSGLPDRLVNLVGFWCRSQLSRWMSAAAPLATAGMQTSPSASDEQSAPRSRQSKRRTAKKVV